MYSEFQKYLPLANSIAKSFSNIPGLDFNEIEIHAQEALLAAARKFDASKGDFTPYASQAIRNALRTLYERQCRHHRHHVYDLDRPGDFQTTESDRIHHIAQPHDASIGTRLARLESAEALKKAMESLPARHREVLAGISEGKSYSEIGVQLGITKQAVHKIALSAVESVKDFLRNQGFGGIDSIGLLASIKTEED